MKFQCSSASRKFLNPSARSALRATARRFSALQRAENSSILNELLGALQLRVFQCSSASRKFLNGCTAASPPSAACVSVLFSEPKIPQLLFPPAGGYGDEVSVLFSEPKIPQFGARVSRAERRRVSFQCSSASRKFLNSHASRGGPDVRSGFSALQRAENSSIQPYSRLPQTREGVSVLFSEPKIPQFAAARDLADTTTKFQCSSASRKFLNQNVINSWRSVGLFQCSSASRKFLNQPNRDSAAPAPTFQCSSASRKFLNSAPLARAGALARVSVLFSEPKIPQC